MTYGKNKKGSEGNRERKKECNFLNEERRGKKRREEEVKRKTAQNWSCRISDGCRRASNKEGSESESKDFETSERKKSTPNIERMSKRRGEEVKAKKATRDTDNTTS